MTDLQAISDQQAPPENEPENRDARLEAFAATLIQKRKDAIDGRARSGIEDQWREDEDAYEGVDEANKGDKGRTQKPLFSAGAEDDEGKRSTVFIPITGPYCDAAAARVADMLLPTDDRPWAIKPTPVPELAGVMEGKFPKRQAMAMHLQFGQDPEALAAEIKRAQQEAERVIQIAKESAERAQTRIDDWLVECQWHAEVRRIIESCTKVGVGIMKGPIPLKRRDKSWQKGIEGYALQILTAIRPGSKMISHWNFYPDADCGENIQNGAYTWERDNITERQLRDMKGLPGYMDDRIAFVLEEGPKSAIVPEDSGKEKRSRYEIWYYHGMVGKEELEAAGCDCSDKEDVYLPACVTMVNDTPIKAVVSPISSGEFPYDVMVWQAKKGSPWGTGVAHQIRVPQRMINAAARMLMDNAGAAAGPMVIFKAGIVSPVGTSIAEIRPWALWEAAEDAEMDDVKKAFAIVTIPMLEKELMAIIQMGLKLAEDVTGLPMIMQGQQGKAPDTVGGMQILNQNASTVLRRIARLFDDRLTEPHIRRYYDWLMEYGEDEDEKGDFSIDARGSSALVDRDLERQSILQMLPLTMNPAAEMKLRIKPDKLFAEVCKAQRLDPKRFQYDDDEWKEFEQRMQQQQPPQDPRIAVEMIRKQLRELEMQFEAAENDKDRNLKIAVEMIDEQMQSKELDAATREALMKYKTSLTEKMMDLRVQERISRSDQHARQVSKPPTEPAGRAKPGMAYQQ